MGMDGMDEMGIFTTNVAINNPAANIVQPPGTPKLPQTIGNNNKVHSKRYGVMDLPEAIYPL
jgi:hypothetical protein